MKLNINFRDVDQNSETTEYVERRLSFAFARVRHALASVSITLGDVNGPKGGVDQQCRIVVKPIGLAAVVVSERQPELKAAIDRGIARASQSLTRKIKRQHQAKKQRLATKRFVDESPEELLQGGL